jgi:long-chain acyl-CoA synthetase
VKDAGFAAWLVGAWEAFADDVALVDGTRSLTYGELREQVLASAERLCAHGLVSGDRVALILDSSWRFVTAYIATLLAGGVAVPLNPAAGAREVARCIAHTQSKLVLVEPTAAGAAALAALVPAESRLLAWSGTGESTGVAPPARDLHPVEVDLPAASPACIHFTSGTTGIPKGVVLTHGNLRSNTRAIIESLALSRADSIVTVLPFFYAYGGSILLTHLACGGRVVIAPGFAFPHLVVESLVRERATGFAGVPSTYALLLARVRLATYDLSTLRYVTQAGGAMSPALTTRLVAALPGKRIFVMYGQTEATARLTCLPPERLAEKLGSVGVPVRGVHLQVRDGSGRECAVEEVGDIWASGPNIMAGYWRNAEATSAVLRDGWLKTGDVGRLDRDGFLYIVGRRSDIIKVGAHRVHPQDVEFVLAELPEVAECAVVGVAEEILGEVVKAFIVLRPGMTLQPEQVKRHCLANLAAYKVPKTIEYVAALPRTASGKVRRAALQTGE